MENHDEYEKFREKIFREQSRKQFVENPLNWLLISLLILSIFVLIISRNKGLREDFKRGVEVVFESKEDLFSSFVRGVKRTKEFSNRLFYDDWKDGESVVYKGDTIIPYIIPPKIQKIIDNEKENFSFDIDKVWFNKIKIKTKGDSIFAGYVRNHMDLAVSEMLKEKIPASIKLAQALLESNAGLSDLAKNTYNHFGIKCKAKFKGACRDKDFNPGAGCDCFNFDDDDPCDRFRVYCDGPEQSFVDHSMILLQPRYREMFRYQVSEDLYQIDKKWYGLNEAPYYALCAMALKKGGYATDEYYHIKISSIINRFELWRIDFAVIEMVNKFKS